jgi:hypothetical protein
MYPKRECKGRIRVRRSTTFAYNSREFVGEDQEQAAEDIICGNWCGHCRLMHQVYECTFDERRGRERYICEDVFCRACITSAIYRKNKSCSFVLLGFVKMGTCSAGSSTLCNS